MRAITSIEATMGKRINKNYIAAAAAVLGTGLTAFAADAPVYKTDVDVVLVSFTVTDAKGKHVEGLMQGDVKVLENGIEQKITAFMGGTANGDGAVRLEKAPRSVFVLLDTSNCMYDGFVHSVDTVGKFIRGLDKDDSVAVYTFSKNMARNVRLTQNKLEASAGLRKSVLGDDTALYNSLLLTLRDAEKVPGQKTIVVFSNGPDNASIIGPDDVRRVAEDAGIPIYVISTRSAGDDISSAVFTRLTKGTGGEIFTAKDWTRQDDAFAAIRENLAKSYVLTYSPAATEAVGYRKIDVEVSSDVAKKYRIRARQGYRPVHKPAGARTAYRSGGALPDVGLE